MTEHPRPEHALSEDPLSEHTVAARLSAFAPPVTPPDLPMSDVSYVVEDTAVGRMLLARNESGALITSAYVPDTDAEDAWLQRLARQVSPRVLRLPRALDEARRELDAYLRGQRKDFDVPIALVLATSFQRIVLGHLPGAVAYGHRTTYGALAKEIERPSASRAVGAALGANPLCVVLPCHRVVASSGALTGYAGGLAAKEYLLTLEARP
jgi:methylated-DNA-[protein]-cysteine S-methyltransferase